MSGRVRFPGSLPRGARSIAQRRSLSATAQARISHRKRLSVIHNGRKELSTKEHERRRRATKRDGSATSQGAAPRQPGAHPSGSKSDGSRRHPGASRPHALPLPAAQFPWNVAAGHAAGWNGMGSTAAEPYTSGSLQQKGYGRAPPGARASRPHRTWQYGNEPPEGGFAAPCNGVVVDGGLLARTRLRAGRSRERGRLARIGPGNMVTNPARADSPHLAMEWSWMAGCLREQGCGRNAPGGLPPATWSHRRRTTGLLKSGSGPGQTPSRVSSDGSVIRAGASRRFRIVDSR